MKSLKILVATGGSGGHIFPALITAEELKKRGHIVVFAGVLGQNAVKMKTAGFECFEIQAKGFSSRSAGVFLEFLLALVKSFAQSWRILKEVKPDIVVGFGGYGSFALVLAACFQAITTVIQEQNVVPGKANRLLSFFVKKIAVGFQQTKNRFPAHKVIFTGCPLRPLDLNLEKKDVFKEFGFLEQMPVILVLGGSQGSRRLNAEFVKTAEILKEKMRFSVLHVCGPVDADFCRGVYQNLGIAHRVVSFTDEIFKFYTVADLVVSRAGAMTITEIAAFSLRAVLIPYPYAGGHQRDNALVLTKMNTSRLIEEKDLTSAVLAQAIEQMFSLPMRKADVSKNYEGVYCPQAAGTLAYEIERLKP